MEDQALEVGTLERVRAASNETSGDEDDRDNNNEDQNKTSSGGNGNGGGRTTIHLKHHLHLSSVSSPTYKSRCKMLVCPFQSFRTVTVEHDKDDDDEDDSNSTSNKVIDSATHIVLIPESLRMLAYVNFDLLILFGVFFSLVTGNVDYYDNPIREHFGFSNICIYVDDPPMSYIVPFWYAGGVMFPMLSFLIFDNFRIYDRYKDEIHNENSNVTYKFYKWYTVCSIYVAISFMTFTITFGVSPYEQIQVHTYPFLAVMMGWWFLSIQRVIYFKKIGQWDKFTQGYNQWQSKLIRFGGNLYVFILGWTVITAFLLNGPVINDAFEWYKQKDAYSEYNDKIMTVCLLVTPVFGYFLFTHKMETIEIVINRQTK